MRNRLACALLILTALVLAGCQSQPKEEKVSPWDYASLRKKSVEFDTRSGRPEMPAYEHLHTPLEAPEVSSGRSG